MELIIVFSATTLIAMLLKYFRVLPWMTLSIAVSYGLGMMFIFSGSTHYSPLQSDFVRMIPPFLPYPEALVFITGILEILGGLGLFLPRTRFLAAICLILLLIAMFPANIYAALANITFMGQPAQSLWTRVPEQLLYIALLSFAAFSHRRAVQAQQVSQ